MTTVPPSLAHRAMSVVEAHAGAVGVMKGRSGELVSHPDPELARLVLAKCWVRTVYLASIEKRGWLEIGARTDFLAALFEKWRQESQGHLFQQVVAQVLTKGLSRRGFESRNLLEKRIGKGPNLGSPVLTEEDFESDFSFEGAPVVVPEAFWEEVIRTLVPEAIDPLDDGLPHFYHLVRKTPNADLYEGSARVRAQSDMMHKVERTRGLEPEERIRLLTAIKVVDPACGPGSVLVHMVRESMARVEAICAEAGLQCQPSKMVRTLVERGLHGLDRDPFAVEVTRLRLAMEVMRHDEEPIPLPDLSRDVEVGEGVTVVSLFTAPQEMPPEGPQVEYKSTLEWDTRKGARSQELLYGVLRTLVAFLNTEGGVLYLGVGDDGNPKGLTDDFALINDASKEDVFENRLREIMKNNIDPIPLSAVTVSFPEIAGIKVCQLVVRPRAGEVTYLTMANPKSGHRDEIYVRDGNRTIALKDRKRDQFILGRSKSGRSE